MRWTPALPTGPGTLHQRLVDALASDIAAGTLGPGMRLPTHRELARQLGISVGTVTRAYGEAERRGYLVSRTGDGSFVAGAAANRDQAGRIDLSRNLPPLGQARRFLTDGLLRLAQEAETFLDYPPPGGADGHRRSIAGWIADTGGFGALDWRRLILCTGAQHAMGLAFAAVARPGDTVLCEAATFAGMRKIAAAYGLALRGVALDAQGLDPAALARAAADSGARVLYVLPSLQNPTARTMGPARRRAVVEVARRFDLLIVEDDVYAPYVAGAGDRPPLASLAPERTFHVGSASKAIAPGLRAGWLVPPEAGPWHDRVLAVLAPAGPAVPAFGPALLARWIDDGTAGRILGGLRQDVQERCALAASILGARIETPALGPSPHLWLPMPALEAERGFARALEAGIALTPPSAVSVDQRLLSGLRLCLGAVGDLATLGQALGRLAEVLADRPSRLEQAVL